MKTSDTIFYDIQTRIHANGSLPAKLTLAALSENYGVSTAPVREAINNLLESKDILKLSNGRLMVNPDKIGIGSEASGLSHDSEAEKEASITRFILARSLGGQDDEFIREEITADKHGIGRTVLRRILSRMAGAGLIIHEPCRGWRIRPFRYREVEEYLKVREMFEVEALRIAYENLDEKELRFILEENVHGGNGADAHLDNRLHRHWIDRCGNYFIRDFFNRHGGYFTTLFEYAAPESEAVDEMVEQHREILNAILEKNVSKAEKALGQHIRDQKPILQRMIERMRGEDVKALSFSATALGIVV